MYIENSHKDLPSEAAVHCSLSIPTVYKETFLKWSSRGAGRGKAQCLAKLTLQVKHLDNTMMKVLEVFCSGFAMFSFSSKKCS